MGSVRILRNSYHILGLSTGVNLVEVRRRAHHLLSLARIQETEDFESDLQGVSKLRSETNVRKALESLSSVKGRLTESFFWFEITTVQDQRALRDLSQDRIAQAIQYWADLSIESPHWLGKKNEALASYVAALHTGKAEHFERALQIIREIILSDQFWTYYTSHYLASDDLGTGANLLVEFRTQLPELISWLAVDLFRKTGDPRIVANYFSQLSTIGSGIETNILGPILTKVRSASQALLALVNEEKPGVDLLRTATIELEENLKLLSSFGVNEYSPIQVLRESCASVFRSASIKAHNDLNDMALAKELLVSGANLTTSESSLVQIERDRKQLDKNEEWNAFIKSYSERAHSNDAQKNYSYFGELESSLSDPNRKSEIFLNMKRRVLVEYAIDHFTKAKKNVDAKNEDEAEGGRGAKLS